MRPRTRTAATRLDQFLADLTVVIVLYRRPLAASPTFHSLDGDLLAARSTARPRLLVYDNSPVAGPFPDGVTERWRLWHCHDPSNPGVSAAYRAGATLAAARAGEWLLFLDQDTELPRGALAAYARAVVDHPGEHLFAPVLRAGPAIVSPCAYHFPFGRALASMRLGVQPLRGISLLNSGLCVRRAIYDAVGGHDPRIPLDFSDHELVARLAARCSSYVLLRVELRHGLSAREAQPVPARLARFGAYCAGALRTPRSRRGRLRARAFVVARGAVLAWRWRHVGFLTAALRYAFHRE